MIPGGWETFGDRGMIVILSGTEGSSGEGHSEKDSNSKTGEHNDEKEKPEKRNGKSA